MVADLLAVWMSDKLFDVILKCHRDATVWLFLHANVAFSVFVNQHAHLQHSHHLYQRLACLYQEISHRSICLSVLSCRIQYQTASTDEEPAGLQ